MEEISVFICVHLRFILALKGNYHGQIQNRGQEGHRPYRERN